MTGLYRGGVMMGRRLLRYLRFGLALSALTLCLFSACFWVRGYWYRDSLSGPFPHGYLTNLVTVGGGLTLHVDRDPRVVSPEFRLDALPPEFAPFLSPPRPAEPRWHWHTMPIEHMVFLGPDDDPLKLRLGFAVEHDAVLGWRMALPFWFLTLVCGAAAVLSTSKPRWQFSLWRLLVMVTVAAMVLGVMSSLPTSRS
jgi:hypothetical protein